MKPKEKAIWFVAQMKSHLFSDSEYDAKQCALVAVSEIIEEDDYNNAGNFLPSKRGKYWEDVKREIELL